MVRGIKDLVREICRLPVARDINELACKYTEIPRRNQVEVLHFGIV